MPELIERAAAFAKNAHDAVGHRRKYTGEPYWAHLEAVASSVAAVGGTPPMIAAAWLHDVVEDTPVTHNELVDEFALEVAALVCQLTDVSRPEDGNRAHRKALDRAHIAKASDDAKTIKLADLIDNAESILTHDQRFAEVYLDEMAALLRVLKGGHPTLYTRAQALVTDWQAHATRETTT